MRRFVSLLLFTCSFGHIHAQSLDIELRKDWYAVVPTIDMSVLDTIVLYPVHGNFDHTHDIFLWRYLGGNDYQLKIFNNTMPGSDENYEVAPEHWKLKHRKGNEYYLVVKDHKDPRPFHKKIAGYILVPQRDNYNTVRGIMMVKIYSDRYSEQLKTPSLRN